MLWHINVNCKMKRWEHCEPEEVLICSHVRSDEIGTYKSEDPFANSVPIKGIVQMHMISLNGETTQLWLNSKHEKPDNKPQISLGNASAEIVVAGIATLTKDTKFSYHNVAKIVRGNFISFYATVTETSDTNLIEYT